MSDFYGGSRSCLFCGGDGCQFCRPSQAIDIPTFNKRQKANLAAGRHPLGFELGPEGVHCIGCRFVRFKDSKGLPLKNPECMKPAELRVHHLGSPIKRNWRACEHYEAPDSGQA